MVAWQHPHTLNAMVVGLLGGASLASAVSTADEYRWIAGMQRFRSQLGG